MFYHLYMEEFLNEALNEMNLFLENEEDDDSEETEKEVYKINYYLRDNLQIPYISKVLAKKSVQNSIIEFVGSFLDSHSYQLSTSGPVHMFTFDKKEVSVLYDLFKVNDEMLLAMFDKVVEETFYGKLSKVISGWIIHAPHKLLVTSILIDSIQNNYEDMITCCEYIWAFCEYPILLKKFWQVGVKEDVMNYTIEHLSNKYKIKVNNLKNLQQLLKYDAHSAVQSHMERLRTGADHTYTDFMHRIRNQIKNTFKNISKLYYDNIKINASQHVNVSEFDDGSLADQSGYNTNISQSIESTVTKFISNGVNTGIAKIAADGSKIDKDTLIGYLNQIMATKDNKIYKLIESIITAYFKKYPTSTSLNTGEFIDFGISLFRSIATSNDSIYQEIHSILMYWMNDIIEITKFYQRPGTISAYTRGIYNYVIFMINHYN